MAVIAPPNVSPVLPRWDALFVTQANGRAVSATEWYNFFKELRARVDADAGLQAEIDAIIARLETLEGSTIVGLNSVQTFGSLSDGLVTVMLRGDVAAPGDFRYYGTGPEGERGFWPAASLVAWLVDHDGNYIVDRDGNYIVGEDISPQLFAITGTEPGLIAHTAAGAWASRTIGTSGDPGVTVTAGDGVAGNPTISHDFGATLSAGGTDGQFWRGDKSWSNQLSGGLVFNAAGATFLQTNTVDSSDTASLILDATSGTLLQTRGAYVRVNGNEASTNPGSVVVISGNSADIIFSGGRLRPNANNTYELGATANRWSATYSVNLVLGAATASLGGGAGVAFVSNATTAPTSNPAGGGLLYAEAGAGKWRGSSGTVTTFGPADPHCPKCGSDFVHEWDNPAKYGYLAVCMLCYARGEKSVTFTRGEWSTH